MDQRGDELGMARAWIVAILLVILTPPSLPLKIRTTVRSSGGWWSPSYHGAAWLSVVTR